MIILVNIPSSKPSIIIGILERCDVYQTPTKASARKKEKALDMTYGIVLKSTN